MYVYSFILYVLNINMSLLRSSERLIEGSIGDVLVNPLIGYPITLFELGLIDTELSDIVSSLLPPMIISEDVMGRIDVRGRSDLDNSGGSLSLIEFINREVMRFWALPKKISISLYEQEPEDIYIIQPRVIDDYLIVEEVSPTHLDYCRNVYSLGLGESSEVIGTKYWKCIYIDSIQVYGKYGIDDTWIRWVSY